MGTPYTVYLFSTTACLVFAFLAIWGCIKGDENLIEITSKVLLMIIGYVLGRLYG
jgi:hypothetical protein